MIPLPLEIKIVQKKDNSAVFEIEGLYPGYGITIGNSLRRVLLSSLEGAVITQVKIKNVLHEFSTITGVKEDVVIILLNLKKLRFKMLSPEPQTIILSAKGEKEVKGRDFKLSPYLELANPEVFIATLTKLSAELVIEARVEKGVGYLPVERREIKKSEVGVIPLDAAFTPVTKVSFATENTRVGKRTDFDRLRIEIETDGTLSPEEALVQTSDILLKHFSFLNQSFKAREEEQKSAVESKIKKGAAGKKASSVGKENVGEDLKKKNIEELNFSERTKNALLKNNIKTAGGLLRKSEKTLSGLEGLGVQGIKEIKKVLKKLGAELKAE